MTAKTTQPAAEATRPEAGVVQEQPESSANGILSYHPISGQPQEAKEPLGLVLSKLKWRRQGAGYMAHCPAHEDKRESLSVRLGEDGRVLLKCHAGCTLDQVLAALHLPPSALFRSSSRPASGSPVAVYPYRDIDRTLLFEVIRKEPKGFVQCRPDGKGGRIYNLKGVKRVLYRLPELVAAVAVGRTVFIVEGEKDVENLAARGLDATTNPGGAGKWRPDYNNYLRGASVVLLPDNDDAGHRHMEAVAASLSGVAESVKMVALPGLPQAGDASDWLTAGGTKEELLRLAEKAPAWPPATEAGPGEIPIAGPYAVRDGVICLLKQTRDGSIPVPLCNFDARIVEEVVRDDGAEPTRVFLIQGTRPGDEVPLRAQVRTAEFSGMNWVPAHWGSRAVVYAGFSAKDHTRAAIQLLSGHVPERTAFLHLGWRRIGGSWLYLHANGAIGAAGRVEHIDVSPGEGRLAGYVLPDPPNGEGLRRAVRASLRLLNLGPDHITMPLLAAVYRAPLGEADAVDFSLFLTGRTGVFKTALSALAQAHWGPGWSGRCLPANWAATANSLERQAFLAKDVVLVVDDFAPAGSPADVQHLHADANRLLRGQANRAGRGRMRADGELRPEYFPRGLIVSSGEDVPRGHSLQVRLVIIDVAPGDVDHAALTAAQADAEAGLLAEAMSAYVRWLAPRIDGFKGVLPSHRAALREGMREEGMHARTPDEIASLSVGWHVFLEFAEDTGAITGEERALLWKRCHTALWELARSQAHYHEYEEPCFRFFALLSGAVASGRAHVVGTGTDRVPSHPDHWGWRPDGFQGEYRPCGELVGWVEGDSLLLEPEASFGVAQRMARDQGSSLPVTPRTLWRRMDERGMLASRETERQKMTVRRTIGGQRRYVIHTYTSYILPEQAQQAQRPACGPKELGLWAGEATEQAQQQAHDMAPSSATKTGCGPVGGPVAEEQAHKIVPGT